MNLQVLGRVTIRINGGSLVNKCTRNLVLVSFRNTLNVYRRYNRVKTRRILTVTGTRGRQEVVANTSRSVQLATINNRGNRYTFRRTNRTTRYLRRIQLTLFHGSLIRSFTRRLNNRFNVHNKNRSMTLNLRVGTRLKNILSSTIIGSNSFTIRANVQVYIRVTQLTINYPAHVTSARNNRQR